MDTFFLGMLVFVPAAVIGSFLRIQAPFIFALSALAIIPLAKFIGEATEALSARVGPALGALFNATFGNATELIIGVLAVRQGLIGVVKASLTGSILGNLLFVLGTAMIVGGTQHKKQTFNRTAAVASGSTLFVAAIALIMPAIFVQTAPLLFGSKVEDLSILVSAVMIAVYAATLWFSAYTHKHLYTGKTPEKETPAAAKNFKRNIFILLLATLAVSWVSEILVNSIAPLVVQLGWTELFVGVIFVAIVGNVAEHVSAITAAFKNKMDLALQIAIGSATQIVMFIAPFLVLVSLLFSNQMDLIFTTFELVAMVLAIVLVNMIIEDGESNWLEGVQLLTTYLIMAVAFYLHP